MTVRFSPSFVSKERWRSRPVTSTREPRVSDSATFSATWRHTLHRRNSASPSFHSPDALSNVRGVDATVKLATAAPDWVKRSSGSAVRFPTTVIVVSPAMSGAPASDLGLGGVLGRLRRSLGGLRGVAPHDLGPQHGLLQAQLAVQFLHRVGSRGQVEDGVDALAALVDLEAQPALAPDLHLLHVPASGADDVEKVVQRRCDSALVETGVKDDHHFVMTHEDHSPPVDSRPRTIRGRRVVASATYLAYQRLAAVRARGQ